MAPRDTLLPGRNPPHPVRPGASSGLDSPGSLRPVFTSRAGRTLHPRPARNFLGEVGLGAFLLALLFLIVMAIAFYPLED